MLAALYFFILDGLHPECTYRWEEACTACRVRNLAETVLVPWVVCVTRKCKYCKRTVTIKELRFGHVLTTPAPVETHNGTRRNVMYHLQCKLKSYDAVQ